MKSSPTQQEGKEGTVSGVEGYSIVDGKVGVGNVDVTLFSI